MTHLEKIQKAQKLLLEAHKVLESVEMEDRIGQVAQKKILSDINETYKKIRSNFNTSIWGELE